MHGSKIKVSVYFPHFPQHRTCAPVSHHAYEDKCQSQTVSFVADFLVQEKLTDCTGKKISHSCRSWQNYAHGSNAEQRHAQEHAAHQQHDAPDYERVD